jgi:hypothetical protein
LSAPEGSYNPGTRNLVFVLKAAPTARFVSIDGKPLGAITGSDNRSGWRKSEGDLVIQLADDGKAHQIQVR